MDKYLRNAYIIAQSNITTLISLQNFKTVSKKKKYYYSNIVRKKEKLIYYIRFHRRFKK